MKIATIVIRLLLAAMYLFASVPYFLKIMPGEMPAMTAAQTTFMTGVTASVYLMALIKGTELISGIFAAHRANSTTWRFAHISGYLKYFSLSCLLRP